MKKNLIIPVMGVVVLAVCVLFYLYQTTDKNNKQEGISNLVFETPDFYNNEYILSLIHI